MANFANEIFNFIYFDESFRMSLKIQFTISHHLFMNRRQAIPCNNIDAAARVMYVSLRDQWVKHEGLQPWPLKPDAIFKGIFSRR